MKTKLLFSLLLSFYFYLLSSQIPQGFNYQAIARGSDGKEIASTTMQVKVSILSDTTGFYAGGTGTYIWEEQQTVKTNALGLFTLIIGNPVATKIQGSAASFPFIDWKQQPLFIGTKIDNSGWKNMGTSRLWTVPYAMVAGDLKNNSRIQVSGDTNSSDSILFEVKNRAGQTVFAVYEEGVRIYVDDGVYKGKGKGGFAIGSFGAAKGSSQPLFMVTADSIRGYIDTNPAKALKGGFAIGSFSPAKAPAEEYLRVTRDSTRVNVNQPAKGRKGGFAIGSFSPAKGQVNNFMDMTPKNYFIGDSAGINTSGSYNSFMGYKAGANNSSGSNNAFIGYQAGYKNQTGISNLFVGYQSGYNNQSGNFNSFLGYQAGYSNTIGLNNTFLGSYSSKNNTIGNSNTSVGFNAGYNNISGNENNFIGYNTGFNNRFGNKNIFIGTEAGYNINGGNDNIFAGVRAGYMFILGSRNICIGTEAGWQSYSQANTTSDNIFIGYQAGNPGAGSEYMNSPGNGNIWIGKYAGWNLGSQWYNAYMKDATPPLPPLMNTLVIDNNDHVTYTAPPLSGPDLTHYPLLFGNFAYDTFKRCVVINGVNNHGYTFFVNGSSGSYGAWGVSDAREKKNVHTIENSLNKVLAMHGVNFEWIDSARGGGGIHMGFIAQEAVNIIPEAVQFRNNSYTMNYSSLTALLVEGMKDQQKIIESQRDVLENQEKQIHSLEELIPIIKEQQNQIDELKAMVDKLVEEKLK
jgi:hypothetical protein